MPVDEQAQTIALDSIPKSLRPGYMPPTTLEQLITPMTKQQTVYLLTDPQDTERTVVVAVARQVPDNADLRDVLLTLFGQATTPAEQEDGYFNTLELFRLNNVTLSQDVTLSQEIATIDITPISVADTAVIDNNIQLPPNMLKLAAAQLVFTVAEWGNIGTRILLDGQTVPIPTSDDDAEPGFVLNTNSYEQFQPNLNMAPTTMPENMQAEDRQAEETLTTDNLHTENAENMQAEETPAEETPAS